MTTQTTINWDDAPITATHFDPYDDADSKWMKLLDGQWYYWNPSGDGNDNWSIAHLAPYCGDQFIARYKTKRMSPVYEAFELWKCYPGPVSHFLQVLYERGMLVHGDEQ